MTGLGQFTYGFHGRADYSQHPAGGIKTGQVNLLDGPQSLGRCGIASQDHQMASHLEKLGHTLKRKLINHLE